MALSLDRPSTPLTEINTPATIEECHTSLQVDTHVFKWTISNFSLRREIIDQYLESSIFPTGDNVRSQWCLELFPGGRRNAGGGYMSLFLYLKSSEEFEITAKVIFSILDVKGEKKIKSQFFQTFDQICGWGYRNFIELNKLKPPNDTLTILCELSVVSASENSATQPNNAAQNSKFILTQNFGNIFANAKFTDVILVAGDKEIPAHKAIIAGRSKVFAAIFEKEMKKFKMDRVSITDVEPEVLGEILNFIYTDNAPNLHKMPKKLLAAADKFALKKLKAMCEAVLVTHLNCNNAADILILADSYHAQQLKTQTIHFINRHGAVVCESLAWKAAVKSHPDLLVDVYGATIKLQLRLEDHRKK